MDGLTLAIDASTYEGSVALFDGASMLAEEVVAMRGVHEERLMPAVAAMFDRTGGDVRALKRVVCGAGPGSFTSLRIAASIAKGIASAVPCPMYAVSSLVLAAVEEGPGRWLVTMDALRGDVYAQVCEIDGNLAGVHCGVEIIPAGTAAQRAAEVGAHVIVARPRGRAVLHLLGSLSESSPVDLASWEPQYGRKAEAQVKWEAAQGRPLQT
jgi:tRNA threonylcarbamoyladenosine biosynthesis protein TsaB